MTAPLQDRLAANRAALARAEEEVDRLRAERVELWVEGRTAEEPFTCDDLATWSAVSRALVIKQLRARGVSRGTSRRGRTRRGES